MEIIDFSKRLKADFNDGCFNYYPMGDLHIGTRSHADHALSTCVNEVGADPRGVWSDGGDPISGICLQDKRWNPAMHYGAYDTIDKQVGLYLERTEAIGERQLWVLGGNHVETNIHIANAIRMIGTKRGCAWPGECVKAKFNKFYVWDIHGVGSVNSMAGDFRQRVTNEGIRVKRKLRLLQGDCLLMVMHHIHKMRWVSPDFENYSVISDKKNPQKLKTAYAKSYVNPDGTIHEDNRWYLSGGAFQQSQMLNEMRIDDDGKEYKAIMDTYALKAMYGPTELGMWRVRIKDWWVDGCDRGIVQDDEIIWKSI
jgi:hypothetical protein